MGAMEYTAPQHQSGVTGAPDAPEWMPGVQVQIDPVRRKPHVQRRGKGRIASIIVCILAAILSVAVVIGEWAAQTAETDAMLDQIERSEAAMVSAMDTVQSVLQEQGAYDGGLSEEAAAKLSAVAGEAKAEVFAASDVLKSESILSWHRDIDEARLAYLEHTAVWQSFFSRAQLEPTSWFVEDPAIKQTWGVFAGELLDAVPSPSFGSLEDRVRAIVHEDDGATDNSGDTVPA